MIKINKNYTHLFISNRYGFMYPVKKGVYLSFDKTGEYIGIEMFYLPYDYKAIDKACDYKIGELIAKDILEVN